jgi:tRNA 2-selenouridine synthase
MAIQKINIDQFLQLAQQYPVFDVRSPGEFAHAHIPGAYNLPLFSDEERKIVGTAYKQESRETAIKIGLDFFGVKMRTMVEAAEQLTSNFKLQTSNLKLPTSNCALIHCWRGGMRSAGVAWLLDLYGFTVYTLAGGYKTYRNHVLRQFEKPYPFRILGGYTGSGKTEVLQTLRQLGETVIDLEALASHKGSAFGNLGMPPQPGQEMFENLLAGELQLAEDRCRIMNADGEVLAKKTGNSASHCIWLEDESQRIGDVNIPIVFWNQMRASPVFFLDIPFEERLDHIVAGYGKLAKEKLTDSILRIQKRLGPLETKTALALLEAGEMKDCFRFLLKYYDKYYTKGLHNREQISALLTTVPAATVNAEANAAGLLKQTAP